VGKVDIAILGLGWVGKSMQQLFPEALVYDPPQGYIPEKEDINGCDIAFICVPTPLKDGKLDPSIVEEAVSWCECPLLVMRSTVNPGTCDRLAAKYQRRIVMQPEYLGESPAHPMLDPLTRPFLIVGGKKEDRHQLLELYFTRVYNANVRVRQVTNLEAEVIKLSENRAIAWKLAQVQELIDVCKVAGVDYWTVRDAVYGDDPRFDLWWTADHGNKRGFNSKCLPKDVYAWAAWAESCGYDPELTNAILERNAKWISDCPVPISVVSGTGNYR
jgi:UDP-glucose 6-dehydrogenase